jgi:hypothetical protein
MTEPLLAPTLRLQEMGVKLAAKGHKGFFQ